MSVDVQALLGQQCPPVQAGSLASESASLARLSLREKKYAKTKLALLDAATERIGDKTFDAISVKELCEQAEVSEATFFNYFPKKQDLLSYFIQLWVLEVIWKVQHSLESTGGIGAIEEAFCYTGDQISKRPRIMLELIAYMALDPDKGQCPSTTVTVTLAERFLRFPELRGIETIEASTGLDDVFRPPLLKAIEAGELPASTNVAAALTALFAIFFGVPLGMAWQDAAVVAPVYRQQLDLVWSGLRAGGGAAQILPERPSLT